MKYINSITNAACRLIVTLHNHPLGAFVVVLLAVCGVAAGVTWRQ